MKKLLVFVALVAAFVCSAGFCFAAAVADVDQAYVKANVGQPGKVLVDVRSAEIFNGKSPRAGIPGGHIPGAVNFPLADLEKPEADKTLAAAGITKDVEIIAYCNTGKQSGKFIDALISKFGYSSDKIKNYKGSMTDWSKDSANPIESAK